jgi:hypothetical protein
VPLTVLGLSARSRLSGFALEAKEVFLNVAPTVPGGQTAKLVDDARSSLAVVVGRC